MAERLKQLELVGRGGMAEVYRGEIVGERGTRRPVAIKRLRRDLQQNPAAVELFVQEARVAIGLSHPNILQALEFVRDELGYALVCEWLDGVSLREVREQLGALPWPLVGFVGRSVCQALEHLHAEARQVVHRDITPGNVLVTAMGQIKLGDFGVAWCGREAALVRTIAAGTPEFAAPEQAAGSRVDARADLFGLGATLATLADDPPAPWTLVLQTARAAAPSARFASAKEFAAALDEIAQSEGYGHVGAEDLQSWLQSRGGLPARSNPPSLDHAVQAIMGEALAAPSSTAMAVAGLRRRRRHLLLAAVAVAALLSAAYLTSRRLGGDDLPVVDENGLTVEKTAASRSSPEAADPSRILSPSAKIDGPAPAPSLPAAEPPAVDKTRGSPLASSAPATVDGTSTAPLVATERSSDVRARPPRPSATGIPRATPRLGTVHLNAIPWAAVHIDGQAVGNTPLRSLRLSEGRHVVQLRHEPQQISREVVLHVDGNATQTFLVDLRQGTVDKRVQP